MAKKELTNATIDETKADAEVKAQLDQLLKDKQELEKQLSKAKGGDLEAELDKLRAENAELVAAMQSHKMSHDVTHDNGYPVITPLRPAMSKQEETINGALVRHPMKDYWVRMHSASDSLPWALVKGVPDETEARNEYQKYFQVEYTWRYRLEVQRQVPREFAA